MSDAPTNRSPDQLLAQARHHLSYIAHTERGEHHEEEAKRDDCWCGWCASVRTAKEALALLKAAT